MQTGDIVELEISGVAHGGVFIARHGDPGLVVFVPDTLPGERVVARIVQVKKSFARAEALEVLEASPHRVPHIWRQASIDVAPELRPGGADFGHIALAHQRELKARVLTEAFDKFAGGSVPTTVEPVADDEQGTRWRTRVGLHVDSSGRVGPYAARTHDVIEVADHPLATEQIERTALALGREKPGRVDLVEPADGSVRILRRPDARGRGPARSPRSSPRSRPAASSASTRAGSGRCTVRPRRRSTPPCARRSPESRPTPTRTTSTSTAGSACSPPRSPTAAAA